MAYSPDKLQMVLEAFDDYCTIWKLKVNVDKTKIMVFSRGQQPQTFKFSLNGLELEVVNSLHI